MLFFLLILLSSCAKEMIFEPEASDYALNQKSSINEDQPNNLQNCNGALDELKAGDSLGITCLIDLNGKNLTLQENVILNYEGGDIVNGTLTFKGGVIDGRLLNKSLIVGGEVKLKSPIFNFDPLRWDIAQGQTDKRTAFSNRINLEELMKEVKAMGAGTFKIDDFDAYFDVVTNTNPYNQNFFMWREAINVPSDFNLVMSQKTHLRVFPNNSKKYALLAVFKEKNVQIVGGNLHGDRDEHDYSNGGSHEWGHVLLLKSAVNTTVNGVTMQLGSGDGLKIESTGFYFQPEYTPTQDVTIKNCKFDSNRRNNLSVTDGKNIVIDNNEFYGAGRDTENSKGTNPRYAIDVEAHRQTSEGKTVFYEKVEGVTIKNNKQHGSGRGGFIVAAGDNVLIENNEVENGIVYKLTNNTVIKNNRIVGNGINNSFGISAGYIGNKNTSGNEVSDNFIKGFKHGITINGYNHSINNNTIEECQDGISGTNFYNSKIVANTITSTNVKSRGIFIYYTSINRVLFKDNIINVPNNPFKFDLINLEEGQEKYCAHLVNNTFGSPSVGLMRNTVGVSLMKNTINTGVEIFDSKNFVLEDNVITSKKNDGIYLRERNVAVKIMHNAIDVPVNKDCIRIQNTTSYKDVEEISNNCLN